MEKLQSNLFFPLAGVAAVASLASCAGKQKTAEQQPLNIVYIMTDDHTAQMMSCYDTRYMETPNLDRIAADGVRFTQSFVANSLSGPSRACMITGKHSCANKFYDNTTCVFDSSQQTFPKLLRKVGYQTALVGKWTLRVCHQDLITGKSSPDKETTIIRTLSRRTMIPFRNTAISPILLRMMPSTGWKTSVIRKSLSAF